MADQPPADQTNAVTGGTTASFGESEYGPRLDYSVSKYQDLWAMIAFYVHIVLIIVLGIVWMPTPDGGSSSDATPSPTGTPSPTYYYTYTYTTAAPVAFSFDFSGVFIVMVSALFAAALFAILWLKLIEMFAESIIKILLFVQIGVWVGIAIVGFAYEAVYLQVVGILVALLLCLYTWCIWSRIPFAAACLSIASTITMTYHGTIWFALLTVFLNFIWTCIWMTTASSYAMNQELENSGLVNFLLFVSYYWGTNVWRNVSHTTTCGVAATWYFNSGKLENPSRASFGRTMTTSFGSICFGSLIVALLQALRAMLRNSGCRTCLICFIKCIEALMRFFNRYAFAQVAIYGSDFWISAKRTWDLFMSRGIAALVNDDLSGLALTCGAVMGAAVSGFVAYLVGSAFYPINDITDPWFSVNIFLVVILIIFSAWLGYYVVVIVLLVVASGVVAIFVCFAEDPAALSANRPEMYAKLTESKEELMQMATTGSVQPAGGQQAA